MRELAKRPENERRDIFRTTAQAMSIHEAIVEKDFWVCWVLDYLFNDNQWKDSMVFKGGTSLSKAFAAIERFSEDIDLIIDWKLLGISDQEPWKERSATKQDKFGKEANRKTAEFLIRQFVPCLNHDLKTKFGMKMAIDVQGQNVLINYPKAFSLGAIRPEIILEIGPLAESVPCEKKDIVPYAAQKFPTQFTIPKTVVTTISAERTFWEKATILHQEAHRSAAQKPPQRYSRHCYDLYSLSCLPYRKTALAAVELLNDVVQFKIKFYHCAWARYEDAKPGSICLTPPNHNIKGLRDDYDSMKSMLFGAIPSFDEILAGLEALENEINGINIGN